MTKFFLPGGEAFEQDVKVVQQTERKVAVQPGDVVELLMHATVGRTIGDGEVELGVLRVGKIQRVLRKRPSR